jgi:hypothetical protein
MAREEPCFLCQLGTMTGISGIKPSSRLDLLPNVITAKTDSLLEGGDEKRFTNHNPKAAMSLNAKYSLATNATAEITVNPDFSQVESDATQIDVNSPYALSFEERRPFFQEGADMFAMNLSTVYTRSINDPQVAGKVVGKFGRTSVAYLLARDDHAPLMVPLRDGTEFWLGGKSTSNIVRVKQTFLANSYFGVIATDRRLDDGGTGTVFGGDAKVWVLKNFGITAQMMASRMTEPNDTMLSPDVGGATFERGKHTVAFDGEEYWGHAAYMRLEYNRSRQGLWLSYKSKSPTYRADNGFIERNDTRETEVFGNLFFRPNGKVLLTWEPNIDYIKTWDFSGRKISEMVVPQFELQFTQQTFVWTNMQLGRELFAGKYFTDMRAFQIGVDSRPCGWLGFGGYVANGKSIAKSPYIKEAVLGTETDFSFYGEAKLTKQLDFTSQIVYSTLNHPDTSMNLFTEYVWRNRLAYQFTREWFLRIVVEYVHSGQAVYNADADGWWRYQENGLRIEPLLSYKLNPFTIFYIGSASEFGKTAPDNIFRRNRQHYFAKLQYLIRV